MQKEDCGEEKWQNPSHFGVGQNDFQLPGTMQHLVLVFWDSGLNTPLGQSGHFFKKNYFLSPKTLKQGIQACKSRGVCAVSEAPRPPTGVTSFGWPARRVLLLLPSGHSKASSHSMLFGPEVCVPPSSGVSVEPRGPQMCGECVFVGTFPPPPPE